MCSSSAIVRVSKRLCGSGFRTNPTDKISRFFICFYLETGGLPLEYKSFLSKVPRLLNRGNSEWITVLFHTIRGDGGDVVLVCC